MPELHRRALFHGAFAAIPVALHPAAEAASNPLRQRALQARASWATATTDAEALLFVDRLETEHPEARQQVRRLASGLGAFNALRDLLELDMEDQVHPDVQATLLDALQAVGELGEAGIEVMEDYCSTHGTTETGEAELRLSIRAMRLGVKDWKTTVGRQKQVDHALHTLAADPRPGKLIARVRRQIRRARRLSDLSDAIFAEPNTTGLAAAPDPALANAVRRGIRRWYGPTHTSASATDTAEAAPDLPPLAPLTPQQKAAIVGLGLLAYAGAVVGLSVVCVGICAETAFLPLALLSFAVMGLALWGFMSLSPLGQTSQEIRTRVQAGMDAIKSELRPASPETVEVSLQRLQHPQPLKPRGSQVAKIRPATGNRRLLVTCSGLLRRSGQGAANANGTATAAGPDAPLPGAPSLCLIAQVAGRSNRVGTVTEVFVPSRTPVSFQINATPSQLANMYGTFNVNVFQYKISTFDDTPLELPPELQWRG